jgi:uncharacterized coiled-coil protein SlyX
MTEDSASARARRAWVAVLTLVMLFAAVPGPSRASVSDRMRDARTRLEDLTAQIQNEATAIGGLRDQLAAADARIDGATHTLSLLMDARRVLEVRTARADARYRAAQARLNEVAAQAFMNAPGATADVVMFGAALDATSIEELGDRMTYSSAVGQEKAAIADKVSERRSVLDQRSAALDEMLSQQESTVSDLASARTEQADALDREEAALADLERTRDQVIDLLARLRNQLISSDYDAVGRAFQGDAHVPYGRWAGFFLSSMHLPTCHENLVVVVAWEVQEFTQAAWNPLATTHRMTGSTDFNSVGVQNYVSLAQGLDATHETLDYGADIYRYGAIVDSLAACNDAMTTAGAVNASRWCAGCGNGTYLVAVVPKVEADYATYARI